MGTSLLVATVKQIALKGQKFPGLTFHLKLSSIQTWPKAISKMLYWKLNLQQQGTVIKDVAKEENYFGLWSLVVANLTVLVAKPTLTPFFILCARWLLKLYHCAREEQNNLKQFMRNRKNPEEKKKEEQKANERESFHSAGNQFIFGFIILAIFIACFLFFLFVITVDQSYQEKLNTKLMKRNFS